MSSTAKTIKIVRDFNLATMQHPQELHTAALGSNVSGAAVLTVSKSMAEGGELIALLAEEYGVLDVAVVASDSYEYQ